AEPRQAPGRLVGDAEITRLARGDQTVEGLELLVQPRQAVGPVRLIEVDVVGAEPAQGGFERTFQMVPVEYAGATADVRRHRAEGPIVRACDLGGDQYRVARLGPEPAPDDRFGAAVGVRGRWRGIHLRG